MLFSFSTACQRDSESVNEFTEVLTKEEEVDGGICCMVQFALSARATEVAARLILGEDSTPYAMTLEGQTWSAAACTPLVDSFYYFETEVPVDGDDAGASITERINETVPTSAGGFIGTINLFTAAGATSCETLDAGSYGAVGPADGG